MGPEKLKGLVNNLVSVRNHTRQEAFENLKKYAGCLQQSQLNKISYGLFFFFWHSDGYENQTNDSEKITGLFFSLSKQKAFEYFEELLLNLKDLWHQIDYHRKDKYLRLLRVIFFDFFKLLDCKKGHDLYQLDKFLIEKILFDTKSKGILQQYLYIMEDLYKSIKIEDPCLFFMYYKPFFDIIAFQKNEVLLQSLKIQYLPNLYRNLKKFDRKFIQQFYNFMKIYCKDESIPKENARKLKEILNELKQILQQAIGKIKPTVVSKPELKKQSQEKIVEEIEIAQEEDQNDRQEESDQNHQNGENLEEETNMEEQDKDEIIDLIPVDYTEQNQNEDIVYINGNDFSDDQEKKYFMNEFGMNEEELKGYFEEADDIYNPYSDMSQEEILENCPPYMFKTPKQKRKFFKNLNRKYKKKILGLPKRKIAKNKNIIFNLNKNNTKLFKKNQKITL